jgi:hypothetical protein
MSTNLNNLCIISFFTVLFLSLIILYKNKPIWITKKKDDTNVICYTVLVFYSLLFSSLTSIIILLTNTTKSDFCVKTYKQSSILDKDNIYA